MPRRVPRLPTIVDQRFPTYGSRSHPKERFRMGHLEIGRHVQYSSSPVSTMIGLEVDSNLVKRLGTPCATVPLYIVRCIFFPMFCCFSFLPASPFFSFSCECVNILVGDGSDSQPMVRLLPVVVWINRFLVVTHTPHMNREV